MRVPAAPSDPHALSQALERAYAAFASYGFEGLHWADQKDCNADYYSLDARSAALSHPLTELSAEALFDYYYEAVSILGTIADFKHRLVV